MKHHSKQLTFFSLVVITLKPFSFCGKTGSGQMAYLLQPCVFEQGALVEGKAGRWLLCQHAMCMGQRDRKRERPHPHILHTSKAGRWGRSRLSCEGCRSSWRTEQLPHCMLRDRRPCCSMLYTMAHGGETFAQHAMCLGQQEKTPDLHHVYRRARTETEGHDGPVTS